MPGTPATTTNLSIPRYSDQDPADFPTQWNAGVDLIDSRLAMRTLPANALPAGNANGERARITNLLSATCTFGAIITADLTADAVWDSGSSRWRITGGGQIEMRDLTTVYRINTVPGSGHNGYSAFQNPAAGNAAAYMRAFCAAPGTYEMSASFTNLIMDQVSQWPTWGLGQQGSIVIHSNGQSPGSVVIPRMPGGHCQALVTAALNDTLEVLGSTNYGIFYTEGRQLSVKARVIQPTI